jgi:hypothetical protein
MFVTAMMGKRFVVYPDNDVAKCDGAETTITRQHQEASVDATAGNFNRAFDNSGLRADGKRNNRKQQARGCGGKRPSVPGNDEYATHNGN